MRSNGSCLGAVFDVARGAKSTCTFGPILCNKKSRRNSELFFAPVVLISAPPGSAMGVIPALHRRLLGRQACADSGRSPDDRNRWGAGRSRSFPDASLILPRSTYGGPRRSRY